MITIKRESDAQASQSVAQSVEYVEMHATCTEDRIAVGAQGQVLDRIVENPVTFITGLALNGRPLPARAARRPSFSLVVGQYGLGKTTLMERSAKHLTQFGHLGLDPRPVLVRLVQRGRIVRPEATPEEFREFLFGPGGGPSLEEIFGGGCLLLLDGLDEVAAGQKEHNAFFEHLAALVNAGATAGRPPGYHVVVSMRQEYLTSVTRDDAQELTALIKSHTVGEPHVNYLLLDWMEPGLARNFLGRRVSDGAALWDSLSRTHALREMLLRPLLLRIFSDLLRWRPELRGEVAKIRDAGDLLRRFVEVADTDQALAEGQRAITPYRWNRGLIAGKSLQLYREGRSAMTLDDVRDIIVDVDGTRANEKPEGVTDEEALKGIHKCPFLLLENIPDVEFDVRDRSKWPVAPAAPLVRFSHGVFFEYFTALGMIPRDETGDFTAFDELVLNVDMRKFLRGMMGTEWYSRTLQSYALLEKDWHEWDMDLRAGQAFRRLNRVRIALLDLMTDPERELRVSGRRIEACIDWLLNEQHQFHPRYLIYNFEAVAVYARSRTPTDKRPAITARFSEILRSRLQKIEAEGIDVSRAEHLLVERMLDIGQRLRLDWVRPYADDCSNLPPIEDEDTQKRMRTIFENIHSTLWV